MDSQTLHLSIEYFGSCGIILSPEKKAALQTSLLLLKNNQKFSRVQFWGKILGVQDDYFIAQGFPKDLHGEKRTFYSKDGIRWGLLNAPTAEGVEKASKMRGRFTGDPSYVAEHHLLVAKEDEEGFDEELISLKEEERLAAVVAAIDHDAVVVPRGAYIKQPSGEVHASRYFEGLSVSEALQLYNYQHFRKAESLHNKSLLERADSERAIDFMDSLEEDVPKGCWSVQIEKSTGVVVLKSLYWMGYFFYHVPETRQYGSIYVGTGEKNIDLPFML